MHTEITLGAQGIPQLGAVDAPIDVLLMVVGAEAAGDCRNRIANGPFLIGCHRNGVGLSWHQPPLISCRRRARPPIGCSASRTATSNSHRDNIFAAAPPTPQPHRDDVSSSP
jgi:hypothetical protein